MRTPVLLLLFNRPDLTAKAFNAIRDARPDRLYVAADGPRKDRAGDFALCEDARRIGVSVDWPCEVKTRFLEVNEGCRKAVGGAITWFFDCETEGIIIEDDCVPDPTFFPFCEALLEKYRSDPKVLSVSGTTGFSLHLGPQLPISHSFVFSKHIHVWGWASWRRAWRLYDADMEQWPAFRDAHQASLNPAWISFINSVYANEIDTWDIQWLFNHWQNAGLSCVPRVNLVSNIGFRPDATHDLSGIADYANRPTEPMPFPLTYPDAIVQDMSFDQLYDSEEKLDEGIAANRHRSTKASRSFDASLAKAQLERIWRVTLRLMRVVGKSN